MMDPRQKRPALDVTETGKRILEAVEKILGDSSFLSSFGESAVLAEIRKKIESADVQQVTRWLAREQPQVIAVVLCLADSAKSAMIFRKIPKQLHFPIIESISHLDSVNADMFELILEELNQLDRNSANNVVIKGGVEKISAFLQNLPSEFRDQLLDKLDERDPTLTNDLRKQVLSIGRIATLLPLDRQKVCALLSDRDLAILLGAETETIREAFFKVISSNRQNDVREQISCLQPAYKRDLEGTRAKVQTVVMELHNRGVIVFPWEDDIVL